MKFSDYCHNSSFSLLFFPEFAFIHPPSISDISSISPKAAVYNMQEYLDEADFIRNSHSEDEIRLLPKAENLQSWVKRGKLRLFSVFFRMNTLKFASEMQYHLAILLIETLQLLSYAFFDEAYSTNGPYRRESPWNLSQMQWLVDICWLFRVDRYFRTSPSLYFLFLLLSVSTLTLTISFIFLLFFLQKDSLFTNFLIKSLKILSTCQSNLLSIPILDSLSFGMNCSLRTHSKCFEITANFEYFIGFMGITVVFMGVIVMFAMLYYDFCFACGGYASKPHPYIKILRLFCYLIIIFAFNFTIYEKVTVYLVISLSMGVILSYFSTQYMPYFNSRICKMRQISILTFTSAVFSLIIGEFFQKTDSSHTSSTMLFYVFTPFLVKIMQIALANRGKSLHSRSLQHISNIYQVEIKGRMLVFELEEAKNQRAKSVFGENEGMSEESFKEVRERTLREIEVLYSEAFKKFQKAEYLYLWSGLLQLHIFESYILAMVQCHKGLVTASRLDSQYAFYHFSRTSAGFYTNHMRDDAYDYVLYEKCLSVTHQNEETLYHSLYLYWAELEKTVPNIEKLTSLAQKSSTMIEIATSNYQLLINLNSKSSEILAKYGDFLCSLNDDLGLEYLKKAEMQVESQTKTVNSTSLSTLNSPLSFFSSENAILTISCDFDTIGEIEKANLSSFSVLGYNSAELIGRNVSQLVPSPFAETHSEDMRKFHESGSYAVVDNQKCVLYFVRKEGDLMEMRVMVKVVPRGEEMPILMAAIAPTKQPFDLLMLTTDYKITATSENADKLLDFNIEKNSILKADSVIRNFAEICEKTDLEEFVELKDGSQKFNLKCRLVKLNIGRKSAFLLKITRNTNEENLQKESVRPISVLRSIAIGSETEIVSQGFSESESEESRSSCDSEEENEEESGRESRGRGNSGSLASLSRPDSSPSLPPGPTSDLEFTAVSPVTSKQIRQVVSYESNYIHKQVFRLKFTLFVTTLLLIIVSMVVFYLVRSCVSYNNELSHFVNLVGDLRFLSLSVAYYTRIITLMDVNFLPTDSRDLYYQWMTSDAWDMHEINLELRKNLQLISEIDQREYFRENTPTWVWAGTSPTEIHFNLMDATSNLALQSFLITQKLPTPPLSLSHRHSFAVYRNGFGELLSNLNKTADFYVHSAEINLEKLRLNVILLIISAVLVLFLSAGLGIEPILRNLKKSKQEVWKVFLEIPLFVCKIMKMRNLERLEMIKKTKNEDLMEEFSERNSENTEENRPKTRKFRKFGLRPRKIIFLKLWLFFLISLTYLYLLYYISFETVEATLSEELIAVNWASRRKVLTRAVNFWCLEAIIQNVTDVGYKYAVKTGQNAGFFTHIAEMNLNELEYVENSLIFGNAGAKLPYRNIFQAKHDELLFTNGCISPLHRSESDCEAVASGAVGQGLHSALGVFVTWGRTVVRRIEGNEGEWGWEQAREVYLMQEMQGLRALDERYLYDALKYSSEMYEVDYQSLQMQRNVQENVLISLYCLFSLVFVCLVLSPMIGKIGVEVGSAWRTCALIPLLYQEEVKALSAVAKDRLDRLKWQ